MTDAKKVQWGCPECGIGVGADEDGLCSSCGETCFRTSDKWYVEALAAARLEGAESMGERAAKVVRAHRCSDWSGCECSGLCVSMIDDGLRAIDPSAVGGNADG